MAVDPKIKQKAEDIRKKIFGSEVRESLASGLEGMSEDVESVKGRQDTVETTFQEVIDETTDKDVISAPELIAARNGKSNLKTRLDDEHAQVTAQLQQTEQELSSQLDQTREEKIALNRLINDNKKQNKKLKLIKDDFSFGLNNFTTTQGFRIDENGELTLDVTADEPPHTNVALMDSINDAKTIEITLGNNPKAFRIIFAKDTENFVYINQGENQFNIYNIEAGKINTGFRTPTALSHSFVTGDRVRAVLYNQVIQIYVNDVLSSVLEPVSGGFILPKGKAMAGISQRDYANKWGTTEIKVEQKPYKYLHFSIDDTLAILKDLNDNTATYTSIFDNVKLKHLKSLHDKYGAVFSFYLFYTDGTFDLSQMTDKFKNEFRFHSDWIKLGFHGYDSSSNYGNGTISVVTATTHYNNVMNQIRRFAHGYNIDQVTRLGFFSGSLETCRAFRNQETQAKGFLTADDDRASDYYLNTLQRKAVKYGDDFYDYSERLYFLRTDIRLESLTEDIATTLDKRLANFEYVGQNDILEIFTHESFLGGSSVKNNLELACEWAVDNGYVFDFPMNNLPKQ